MHVKATLLALIAASAAAAVAAVHDPPQLPDHLDASTCPPTYQEHPLLLVSLDGFGAEYLSRGLTPTIQALASKGTRAPYMKPSYPTITFPNHYTMVTGMYPSAHGIIANKFYDPVFKSEFRISRKESLKPRWWGGEPIWKSAEKKGKKAACYFWPGSEVDGNHPTYWYYYNESIPFEHRINQVFSWLELPPKSRPSFITLYMHEPDNIGHDFGPKSLEMEKVLIHVDSMVKLLVEGLQARNLLSCVNLLVVADHGMAEAGQNKVINLSEFIPNLTESARFWGGTFSRMMPNNRTRAAKYEMMRALSCKKPELRVYERKLLPIRWHMGTQHRVEDIVIDLDAGYSVGGDDSFKADIGDHGYDNYFSVMNALFVAHGPDFRRNFEVEAFQNIELYNLMCHLMDLKPAPNNGTWGALHHLLSNPPQPPITTYQVVPQPVRLPSKNELKHRLREAQCEGDALESNEWMEVLKETEKKEASFMAKHLPWGIPQRKKESTVLLIQPDFVTVYSPLVKLPLWTSFTVSSTKANGDNAPWRSDVRLTPEQTANCPIYRSVISYNITRQPLFPPEFTSERKFDQLPYLISNAVPSTDQLTKRWAELRGFITHWAKIYGSVNVVMGPVFDYDSSSFADDLETYRQTKGLIVPTHMFLVVSRCTTWVDYLDNCPHDQVDSLAFIYPQYLPITNCLSPENYAREFSAKVQDVEKITGLELYPNMSYYDRVRLRVRIHSHIWGFESWENRLQN